MVQHGTIFGCARFYGIIPDINLIWSHFLTVFCLVWLDLWISKCFVMNAAAVITLNTPQTRPLSSSREKHLFLWFFYKLWNDKKYVPAKSSCKTDSCQFGFTADWAGQTLLTVCIYNGGMCERWIAGLRRRRLSHMCRARPAVAAPAAQPRRQRRPDTAAPSVGFYVQLQPHRTT